MSNIKELDDRLRAFINEPENFIGSVALVDVLHSIPVLASKDDIYRPRNGESNLNEVFGVAINPFDGQQILIDWSEIE